MFHRRKHLEGQVPERSSLCCGSRSWQSALAGARVGSVRPRKFCHKRRLCAQSCSARRDVTVDCGATHVPPKPDLNAGSIDRFRGVCRRMAAARCECLRAGARASRHQGRSGGFRARRLGSARKKGPAGAGPGRWWPRTESNRRHGDFQSPALPTELLGHWNTTAQPGAAASALLKRQPGGPSSLRAWKVPRMGRIAAQERGRLCGSGRCGSCRYRSAQRRNWHTRGCPSGQLRRARPR
jgi:hypothetical protein